MIADLKPYPATKDSDVPWLGEVPEHWGVRRLKRVVSFSGGGTPSKANAAFWAGDIPWVSPKDMAYPQISSSADHITQEAVASSATNLVAPGALLMVVRSGILRRTIPVGINTVEIALNQDMKALHPRAEVVQSEYLRALVQGNEAALIREWMKHGATVESIEQELLANSFVPLPPLPEQAAIVRFLDYADRRIRRYIRAKQKLIKLLEEQKQAIIHRVVTRGLDPGVRLKPSGVEWLGDVPEHWEVNQIRSIANVVRGGSPRPAGSPLYFHGTRAPWITVGEVTRAVGMYLTTTTTRLTAAGEERSRTIEPGTLLLTNSGATLGIPKISSIRGCINDGVAAFLNIRPRVRKEFLFQYLTTQTVHLKAWVDLGAQPNLNTQIIGGWPVPIPPTEEQAAIVCHIEKGTASITDATSRAHREISLLREYRTRLIADVVTGKLDVREAAARLPEESDEVEPIDEADVLGDAEEVTPDDLDAVAEEAGA